MLLIVSGRLPKRSRVTKVALWQQGTVQFLRSGSYAAQIREHMASTYPTLGVFVTEVAMVEL